MKSYEIDSNIKVSDFENFLNVYDIDNKYIYNLNSTIHFNVNDSEFLTYITTTNAHWPLISYKIYGTTRLAWLLMKLNNVTSKNLFDILPAATKVKYIDQEIVKDILKTL